MPEIKIEELNEIITGQDSNLMILEDDNDTKKITLKNFKRTLIDDETPDENLFYSSHKINTLYTLTSIELQKKALQIELDSLETRFDDVIHNSESELNQIRGQYTESIANLWAAIDKASTKEQLDQLNTQVNELISYITGNTTYNSEDSIAMEIINARNGYSTLGVRLEEDDKFNLARFIKKPRVRGESGNPITIDGTTVVDISVECKDNPNAKIQINVESGNVINYDTFRESPNGGENPAEENSFITYNDFGFTYDNTNLRQTDSDDKEVVLPEFPEEDKNTDSEDSCGCTPVTYKELYENLQEIWSGTANVPDEEIPETPVEPPTEECPCMDECEETHIAINSNIIEIEEKIATIEKIQQEILEKLNGTTDDDDDDTDDSICSPECEKVHEELQDSIDTINISLDSIKKSYELVSTQLSSQASKISNLKATVDTLESNTAGITGSQDNITTQLTELSTKLEELEKLQNEIIKKLAGKENTIIDEVLKEDVVREARFQFKLDNNPIVAGTYYLYFNLDTNLPGETTIKIEPGINGVKYGKALGIYTSSLHELISGVKLTVEDEFDTLFITLYNILGIEQKTFSMTYIVMSSIEELYDVNEKINLYNYLYYRRNQYSLTPENNTIEDIKISNSTITAYPEDAIITVSYYMDIDMQKFYDTVTQAIDYIKSSGKDPEIIDARDGEVTLHQRIVRDIKGISNQFVRKSEVISDAISSIRIKDEKYINIEVDMTDNPTDTVIIASDNLLDISLNISTNEYLTYTNTGIIYNNKSLDVNYDALDIGDDGSVSISDAEPITEIVIPFSLGTTLEAGEYFFYSNLIVNDIVDTENMSICIEAGINGEKTDKAINKFIRSYKNWNGNIAFSCVDNFDTIFITYKSDTDLLKTELEYTNIMLTNIALSSNSDQIIPYISYYHREYNLNLEEGVFSLYNIYVNNCVVSLNSGRQSMIVKYYDDIDGNELTNIVKTLQEKVLETREYCGLIKNPGTYHLLTDMINIDEYSSTLTYPKNTRYKRNNIFSAKVTLNGSDNPARIVKYISEELPAIIDTISLVFYLDKKLIETFPINNSIRIILSSDSYANYNPTNYFDYTIPRENLVNGWNIIKIPIYKFKVNGNPDIKLLNNFIFEIQQNENANDMSIWFNTLIFNQTIKPTVIMAFSGLYDTTTNYLLPYMASKDLPCSLLVNASRDSSATEMSEIIKHRLSNNIDIGAYGYHPNKDELTEDDNSKFQYAGLSAATTWLRDNYVYNPVSYSAPYGNLRPVTVSLLQEIGYKMAISNSKGYIAFFSEKELEVPSYSFDEDSTFKEIKDVIDNAILTNQSVVLSTHEVSEFGDEQSLRMAAFEKTIEYLIELVENEKIEIMSMKQFAEACSK